MPMTKDQILAEAQSLAPQEREKLAEELLLTLTDADSDAIDAAWLEEVRRREVEYQASGAKSSPVEEVVARLLARGRP
jgi:putative addiction module component (TIGR02574 family)